MLKRALVAPLVTLILLAAASADAGWQGTRASGSTARAQAIRIVVPGAAGAATPTVSAPNDQVLFSGGFSYGEDPTTHAPLVTTGSANASASESTDVEASATAAAAGFPMKVGPCMSAPPGPLLIASATREVHSVAAIGR